MHRSMTTAAAGLAVLMMTACGAGDPPAPERSLNAVYALVASTGIDYEPQRTTRGLAARSALVVEGKVAGVSEGRSIGDPELDLPPRSTVLLRVSVEETHKGTRQQAVLVELPSEGSTAADFAAVLPSDLRVLVYAVPARGPNPGEQIVTVEPRVARRRSGLAADEPAGPGRLRRHRRGDTAERPALPGHDPGRVPAGRRALSARRTAALGGATPECGGTERDGGQDEPGYHQDVQSRSGAEPLVGHHALHGVDGVRERQHVADRVQHVR